MPDEYGTIQRAIDSGADTVAIRPGTYDERPYIDHPLTLEALGEGRPLLDGLDIHSDFFVPDPRQLSVTDMHFTGRVNETSQYVFPQNLLIYFTRCALDSGFYQIISVDTDNLAMLSLRSCTLKGQSRARSQQFEMVADTVDGGVSWSNIGGDTDIEDCLFRGGADKGIELLYYAAGLVKHNDIQGYGTGIYAEGMNNITFQDNSIANCTLGAYLVSGDIVHFTNNSILDCTSGINTGLDDSLYVRGNTVLRAASYGIRGTSSSVVVEGNVVGDCGGHGILLEGVEDPLLRNNTSFGNAGSGIEATLLISGTVAVDHNIFVFNRQWGMDIDPNATVRPGCNDWFGNGFGAIQGATPGPEDLAVDPMFCAIDSANVSLLASSPLATSPGCGLIGARGVGCGTTAALLSMFTAESQNQVVIARWRFGAAIPPACWLERSLGPGSTWQRVAGELQRIGEEYVQADSSVAAGLTYWYRVAWRAPEGTYSSTPVTVSIDVASAIRVFPNPTVGPATIELGLSRPSLVSARLFDLAGRQVASLGRQYLAPGKHVLEWNGRTLSGRPAPPGWYVIRLSGDLIAERMLLITR